MLLVSFRLPESWMKKMEDLIAENWYPSRAEIIRTALRDFFKAEMIRKKEDQIKKLKQDLGVD